MIILQCVILTLSFHWATLLNILKRPFPQSEKLPVGSAPSMTSHPQYHMALIMTVSQIKSHTYALPVFEYIKLSSVDTLLNTNKCSAVKRPELCSAFAKQMKWGTTDTLSINLFWLNGGGGRGLAEVTDKNKMAADESCFPVTCYYWYTPN